MLPPQTVIGCAVAVISSAVQSFGITLQRKSHLISNQHAHSHQKKRNMWLLGFFLFIVTNVLGSLIQITTLPLIILSPLQSIGLIFNSIFGCMFLGERFTYKLVTGTVVIALGAFLIAYHGNVPPLPPQDQLPAQRFKEVVQKLTALSFGSWFITTFVVMGFLLMINSILTTRQKILSSRKKRTKSTFPLICRYLFIKGINYGLISGSLTAHTFLFAKSILDVVVATVWNHPQGAGRSLFAGGAIPYLLLVFMLAIIGCQLAAFNLGLAQILTTILYPLCFLVYNLINLINDLLFNQLLHDRMTVSQLLWVLVGLSGVLVGVVLISCNGDLKDDFTDRSMDELLYHLKFPYTNVIAGEAVSSQGLQLRKLEPNITFEAQQLWSAVELYT